MLNRLLVVNSFYCMYFSSHKKQVKKSMLFEEFNSAVTAVDPDLHKSPLISIGCIRIRIQKGKKDPRKLKK
jgi:hypothetical protein